jgi:hypothetical protein
MMDAANNKYDWANGWVTMRWSDMDPSFAGVTVLKSSDKAVCLLADGRDVTPQWFPKSAFRMDKYGAYQPLSWFKSKMTMRQMKAIGYAA